MRFLLAHPNPSAYETLLREALPELDLLAVRDGEAAERIAEADVLLTIGHWLDAGILARASRLRWIQCLISGTDHIAPLLAGRPDVVLTNIRGIHGPQMAETVLLHMFAAYRQVPRLVRAQADGHWDRFVPKVLDGRTAVVIGVGLISRHLAGVLKALGMTVVGVSRTLRSEEGFDRIVPRTALHEAVRDADFVICLVEAAPDTAAIVDAPLLAAMKPSAVLVNVSRGRAVDTAALVEALSTGSIAAAGLDVFDPPVLPADSPLWRMENVFITPNTGGRSDRYEANAMPFLLHNIRAWLAGDVEGMVHRVKS